MVRDAVIAEALKLPRDERAAVANRLIASLDEPGDDGVEAAWLAEAERRLEEVERGGASLEPWEAVRARIAGRLRGTRT